MITQFRRILTAIAALAAFATSGSAAQTITITFDEFAMPGEGFQQPQSPISTQGFNFESLPMRRILIWNISDPHNADPDGATLGNASNSDTIEMTKVGGEFFDVLSIDIADLINEVEFGNAVPPVTAVLDFVGTRSNSTTVTATFTTDTLAGLETFNLPADFTNLVSFAWTPRGAIDIYPFAQVDNIVVAAVPEPASAALLATGLVSLTLVRRRLRA